MTERRIASQIFGVLCTIAGLYDTVEIKPVKTSSRQHSEKKKHWQKKRIASHDDKGINLHTPHPAEGFFAGGDITEYLDYDSEFQMYWERVQEHLEEENKKKVDWVLSQLSQDDFDVYDEVLGKPYEFEDYYYISIPSFLWSFALKNPNEMFFESDKELPPKEYLLEKIMQRIQYCRSEIYEIF